MLRSLVAGQLLASAVALTVPRDLTARQDNSTSAHTIELSATLYGSRFHAPVSFGGETFNLLVDTGSSDTFVIEDEFECEGMLAGSDRLIPVSQDICGFADGAYSIDESSSFTRLDNESFQAIYGAGVARGLMALEDISLGDVTVTQQRFGLVNWSTPMNLGASGVLGLAYPILTSAYELNGTIDEDDLSYQGEAQPYAPPFVTMFRRGLVAPYFSLALRRLPADQESGDGGYMVLGGLPDVELSSDWTTVAAEYYRDADLRSQNGTRLRSYWATTVQRLTYGDNGEHTESYQTVVDSGAPMNYVPRAVAEEYNGLFSPAGSWNEVQQAYQVDCDSEAPNFAVQVGGTTFDLNPDDLILHTGTQDLGGDELCLSAITPGMGTQLDENDPTNTTELYILGASFLKDVVAVFDFGNSQMRFATREDSAASALEVLGTGRFVVLVAMVALFQGLI
ncbi:aspartic peptidase domain-containing protein [Aspergillus aurantiobrunneus]